MAVVSGTDPKNPPRSGTRSKSESVSRKFVIAFSAMFVIPMLIAAYLFSEYATGAGKDATRLTLLAGFVALLGVGGFFVTRTVVTALVKATKEAAAIADGDITRRIDTEAEGEISELAKNFNRITSRLQQTVEGLQTSKKQMQSLLSQICAGVGEQNDLTGMFRVFLNTLLSLVGLDSGAIFLSSRDGTVLKVRVAEGFGKEMEDTVIRAGEGIVGWVAKHNKIVTTSESTPWGAPESLTLLERSMSWAIHVPVGTSGRTRGVISIGLREGQAAITGEDLQMIQNLATQVAIALENAELKRRMEKAYVETVAALGTAVEARDKYTRGHSARVTEFATGIARQMNLSDWFVRDLESAGLLHDIGKIGIPDHILHNRGKLPPDGVEFILGHPIGGENILKPVGSLARLCPIVRHHHERYDGNGYPDKLKGEEIPQASRILSVADSFDAMISVRPYKPTRSREDAIEELIRCKGTQFDPECVDAFIAYLGENPEAGVLEPA